MTILLIRYCTTNYYTATLYGIEKMIIIMKYRRQMQRLGDQTNSVEKKGNRR